MIIVAARILLAGIFVWRVSGAASSAATLDSEKFVVSSAVDAVALARAASRDGVVVDASWVGAVTLEGPIKVRQTQQPTYRCQRGPFDGCSLGYVI